MNLRRLKRSIRKDEQGLARSLAQCSTSTTLDQAGDAHDLLRSYLGYLANWHLRLDPAWPKDRYVDDVEDVALERGARDEVKIRGVLWWGLRSNPSAAHTSEPFEGTVSLRKSGRQVGSYRFIIGGDERRFVVRSAI